VKGSIAIKPVNSFQKRSAVQHAESQTVKKKMATNLTSQINGIKNPANRAALKQLKNARNISVILHRIHHGGHRASFSPHLPNNRRFRMWGTHEFMCSKRQAIR
jgi:hypothetical protein